VKTSLAITISGYNTMVTFSGDKLHRAPIFILDVNLVQETHQKKGCCKFFSGGYLCA